MHIDMSTFDSDVRSSSFSSAQYTYYLRTNPSSPASSFSLLSTNILNIAPLRGPFFRCPEERAADAEAKNIKFGRNPQ